MPEIIVEHAPDSDKLGALGVSSWPIWNCEVSEFPWTYVLRPTLNQGNFPALLQVGREVLSQAAM